MFTSRAMVLAVMLLAAAPEAPAQPDEQFQLRILAVDTIDVETGEVIEPGSGEPITLTPQDGRVSRTFYAQAILRDAIDIQQDLVAFDGMLQDDGAGTFAAAPLLNTETLGFPWPGEDAQSRAGMFPQYRDRFQTGDAPQNDAPSNGRPFDGGWRFDPLDIGAGGCDRGGGCGLWRNIYKFEWSSTDLATRTVTLSLSGENAGWVSGTEGLQTMVPMIAGTFEIRVVPPPGGRDNTRRRGRVRGVASASHYRNSSRSFFPSPCGPTISTVSSALIRESPSGTYACPS